MYNKRSCRQPYDQSDCDTYFDNKLLYTYSNGYNACTNENIIGRPGWYCMDDKDCINPTYNINNKCIFSPERTAGQCAGLKIGDKCNRNIDCMSYRCFKGKCEKGGYGKPCFNKGDVNSNECLSNVCANAGICAVPSLGQKCYTDEDCGVDGTGFCNNGLCDGKSFGDNCYGDRQCLSLNCVKNKCAKSDIYCKKNDDCKSNSCKVTNDGSMICE